MGTMFEFITWMGYNFSQKIGRNRQKWAKIHKHVGGKMVDGVP